MATGTVKWFNGATASGRRRAGSPARDLTAGRRLAATPDDRPRTTAADASTPRPHAVAMTRYIRSIIALPKPEHDTCVAPGIRRAKS